MAFAGLKKDDDIENVIAYLKTFSEGAAAEEAAEAPAEEPRKSRRPPRPMSRRLRPRRMSRITTAPSVSAARRSKRKSWHGT
jgi:hypothetical protein